VQKLTVLAVLSVIFAAGNAFALNTNLSSSSITLSSNVAGASSNYTLKSRTKHKNGSDILVGATVSYTFPAGTNCVSITAITFKGKAVATWTNPTTNSVQFSVPATAAVGLNTSFTCVLTGVTNPKPGSYRATAQIQNSSGGNDNGSYAYTITAGVPAKLAFLVQPANTPAGLPNAAAVSVVVQDSNGNTCTTATNSITMAIGFNPSAGTLSGTKVVSAVNGVAVFNNLIIDKTGTGYTLIASPTIVGLTPTPASNPFNITNAVPYHFVFTKPPVDTAAGAIIPEFELTVEDNLGNAVKSFPDSIGLTITAADGSGGANVSGISPVTPDPVTGIAQFQGFQVNQATDPFSLYTVTATDLASGTTIPSIFATIKISVGGPDHVAFNTPSITDAQANDYLGDSSGVITCEIHDKADNLLTSVNSGTITISITGNPVGVTLNDDLSNGTSAQTGNIVLNIAGGVVVYTTTWIDKTGNYTLSAQSSLTGATVTQSNSFNITPADPGTGTGWTIAFTQQPQDTPANTPISPAADVEVTLKDTFGNIVTDVNSQVPGATITMSKKTGPAAGVLSGTTIQTFTSGANGGIAVFNDLKIDINNAVTPYTLNAHFLPSPPIAGDPVVADVVSSSFFISPAPTSALQFFVQPPASTVAGTAMAPAVQVKVIDPVSGNPIASYGGTITITLFRNTVGGVLSGGSTPVAPDSVTGIATFSALSVDKVDNGSGYSLKATSSLGATTTAVSNLFDIIPGAPHHLAYATQPVATTVAGSDFTPINGLKVEIRDSSSNLVTTDSTDTVSLAIGANPGSGTLSGTNSAVVASGVATFTGLSINKVGTGYTLNATTSGLTGATSSTFNITFGIEDHTVFVQQPSDTAAGAAITPAVTVAVVDKFGNTVKTATDSITVAIGTNPSGGKLSGTTTASAVSGVATFSNLSIDKVGTGYTLKAGATSAAFNITAAPPLFTSAVTAVPSTATVGQVVQFTATVSDTTTLSYSWDFGDGTVSPTSSGSNSHAYAAPGVYTVVVTATDANGLTASSSVSVTVVAGAGSGDICAGLNPVALSVQQVAIKLAFPSSLKKDSLSLKATPQLPDAFAVSGMTIKWEVGGIIGTAVLDAKGGFKSTAQSVRLTFKKPAKGQAFTARAGKLQIQMKGQDLSLLTLGGISVLNAATPKTGAPATADVCVVLVNIQAYHKDAMSGLYKVRVNKSGAFSAKSK
jgi:hypothetical protein